MVKYEIRCFFYSGEILQFVNGEKKEKYIKQDIYKISSELVSKQEDPYQLLKTFLPRVWLLILFWVYLVELPCLRVHHGSCVFKNFHVQPLPET